MNCGWSILERFQDIPTKVANTITSRKFKNLSQVGKLILINNILIAYMPPTSWLYFNYQKYIILNQVSSLILKFWWASSQDRKPIYWRKQSVLEKHKSCRGLGLRNLHSLSRRYFLNKHGIWLRNKAYH